MPANTSARQYICTRIPHTHSKQKFINALYSLDLSSLCIHHKLLRIFDFLCNKSLQLVLNSYYARARLDIYFFDVKLLPVTNFPTCGRKEVLFYIHSIETLSSRT